MRSLLYIANRRPEVAAYFRHESTKMNTDLMGALGNWVRGHVRSCEYRRDIPDYTASVTRRMSECPTQEDVVADDLD